MANMYNLTLLWPSEAFATFSVASKLVATWNKLMFNFYIVWLTNSWNCLEILNIHELG